MPERQETFRDDRHSYNDHIYLFNHSNRISETIFVCLFLRHTSCKKIILTIIYCVIYKQMNMHCPLPRQEFGSYI